MALSGPPGSMPRTWNISGFSLSRRPVSSMVSFFSASQATRFLSLGSAKSRPMTSWLYRVLWNTKPSSPPSSTNLPTRF